MLIFETPKVLPSTFRDGGLVLSLIVNPLIGLLSCLCIHRILSINRLLMNKANAPPLDYHEVIEKGSIQCRDVE